MEFHHLRCFLAVAEELHFAKAAERLHVDQSPLSRTIKELEEELGAQLFVRTTRSTRLTRAGKLFLEHVPRVLLPYSRLKTVFRLPPRLSRANTHRAIRWHHAVTFLAAAGAVPPGRT
ncbi:LysR family transcriptional regulator [Pectobacterium aroidearum]|uniref:LysR family transcriptional regulator n=2 Tax=Pectobacterium aroidearum TaxID=1201031 RepID=A0AAW3SPU6_9GAMM|nr:LysR family transcriptional regulator [Pectobacterium aroidearum]MBA5238951.1 LysR family transcriptional regulator [Pectobacterium aroidearum]